MITKVKHLKFVKKLISKDSRERGNVLVRNGQLIFTATIVTNGVYSIHYWIGTKDKLDYKGQLNLPRQAEDPHLSYYGQYGGQFQLYTEDKTAEQSGKHEIVLQVCPTLNGEWKILTKAGLSPSESGWDSKAVYSPLAKDILTLLYDGRVMVGAPSEENIGFAKWIGNEWVKNKEPILEARKLFYATLGVGGDIHRVGDKYILEIVGLLGYYKDFNHVPLRAPSNINPKSKWRWVNGLAECSTLTGNWKIINRELKDEQGRNIWATFFKDNGKWCALASLRDSSEIYLAEIITKDSNGGSMKPEIEISGTNLLLMKKVDNAIKYEWQVSYEQGHHKWIGSTGISDTIINIKEEYRENGYEFFCYAKTDGGRTGDSNRVVYGGGTIEPEPLPEPTNNAEYVAAIKAELVKFDNSQSIIYSNLNKIK